MRKIIIAMLMTNITIASSPDGNYYFEIKHEVLKYESDSQRKPSSDHNPKKQYKSLEEVIENEKEKQKGD